MGNLSYCQFRNTASDFKQCLEAIGNAESIDDISKSEQQAAEELRQMADEYCNWYDQLTGE